MVNPPFHRSGAHQTGPRQVGQPIRQEAGQALVEFLAVALALVPLLVLVPLIGRLQDQAHAVEMASRLAAFDHALRAPLAQQPPVPDAHGRLAVVTTVALPASAPFEPVVQAALGLVAPGLHQTQITQAVPNTLAGLAFWAPFDQLDLRVTRRTTLLTDGWAAPSPQQVDGRVAGMVPGAPQAAAILPPVMGAARPFVERSGVPDSPAFADWGRWTDVVPADRLRPNNSPSP